MKNKLILKTPASWWGAKWREALPSGNGTIGAAVCGGVHDEKVLLTHEDLWHDVVTEELPDVSGELPKVRELLFSGEAAVADGVVVEALKKKGYDPDIGTPLPLGDLKIRMPVNKGFRNYRRTLDMETGEAVVSWEDDGISYSRSLFVSRPDNLVVMEIRGGDASLMLDVALGLHDLEERGRIREKPVHIPEQVEIQTDSLGFIRYAARNDDGTDFGAVARVLPFSAVSAPSRPPVLSAREGGIHIEAAERVLVVVKLFVQDQRHSAWAELTRQFDDIVMDYHTLLAPHVVEHGELFSRVHLDLSASAESRALSNEELLLDAYQGEASTAFVEKMWAYGRYLLISSSREGGQPCHLYGNWCGEYRGYWAFNMANENLQMIYWQANSGQLSEMTMPVFDYYDRMMDDFRENARKLYGCRGIFVPAVTTPPSGLLKTIAPHIIHWTGAAAWIAHHYYDHFVYTGDEEFLRERALPFLRETVLFYEDFLFVGDDGCYVSAPSNSPENSPGNYWDGKGMGSAMQTTINATMDFALIKEVLTNLIEGAHLIGQYAGEIPKWEAMLTRIPPYEINADGAVSEWMHPFFEDNYHHRHLSHIYPVFPGKEVTRKSDPELFEAFAVAIRKRLEIGISEQTGWSLAHMACIYGRMRDGNQALECLNLLARSSVKSNFFTTHNDWRNMGIGVEMEWAPFQIDANMGWSFAVQNMLLFSYPGRLSVLPALPKKWKRGAVSGLMARGGIRVSISWDEKKIRVELFSAREQSVDFSVQGGELQVVELKAEEPQTIFHVLEPVT